MIAVILKFCGGSFKFKFEWCRKLILLSRLKFVTGMKPKLFIGNVNKIELNWIGDFVQYRLSPCHSVTNRRIL